MKRFYTIFMIAILAVVACSKEDNIDPEDALGGHSEPDSALASYMLDIANDIVAGSLEELEDALAVGTGSGLARYFYTTNGLALTETGAIWTVQRDGELYGLQMTCLGETLTWRLDFGGKLKINGYSYPTEFSIVAKASDPTQTGHRSWNVSLTGDRTEKDGFTCHFASDGLLEYRALSTSALWGAYGYVVLDVYENRIHVDKVVMELRGGKSSTSVVHIR